MTGRVIGVKRNYEGCDRIPKSQSLSITQLSILEDRYDDTSKT
ncbi:hypothetical protein QUB33_01605 [Microcoleus sp. B3-A4]